jgi:hypothetical protein
MARFESGETVLLRIEVKDAESAALTSPTTSMQVTVTPPAGGVPVVDQDMVNDGVGEYHYDYTAPALAGVYEVLYVATDGSRVTKQRDSFEVRP